MDVSLKVETLIGLLYWFDSYDTADRRAIQIECYNNVNI